MILNAPDLVRTLAQLHDAYEEAIIANDVPALTAFFWDSPQVVRYGVAEQLYGADAVLAYRQGHSPDYTDRRIARREIATFGSAFATVMSEMEMVIDGQVRISRQSQTWVLIPDLGWRIVAAHVSNPVTRGDGSAHWGAYIDQVAPALNLPVAAAHRPGVVGNLERTAAIAAPLLAFALPEETDPAFVFTA
jgi:hypothetical protein